MAKASLASLCPESYTNKMIMAAARKDRPSWLTRAYEPGKHTWPRGRKSPVAGPWNTPARAAKSS